ncbi:disulfide bond formation protein B [Shinella pollutisoli]|uniref:Disulfide bond formation protein B n=1 Tax=Shinella pollutisoli TaxID=2250594 RepID=A0ABV7DC26_9HYPH|nr:disulfide bond formation protein B [Shinella pollutisoli]
MTASLTLSRKTSAVLLALGMAATVGGALAFEHVGGYIPCALCLLQRDPYYYGIPVAVAAALSAALGGPAWLTRGLLAIVGITMLVGAGMGVYHAGVEWGFWEGPATCATTAQAVTQDAGDLLADLNAKHGPSCTEASLRVLGLSFAGWNVIASLILAAIAFAGVRSAKA